VVPSGDLVVIGEVTRPHGLRGEMRVTLHTAPAFRVLPSMIEASNSMRPSSVKTAPRPSPSL